MLPVVQEMQATNQSTIKICGRGVTSRRNVNLEIKKGQPGQGIVFQVARAEGDPVSIPAQARYVVNTLRNVVLGKDGVRLCIVEHFLAALSLWGLSDIEAHVDGLEMPLSDGSAAFYLEHFQQAGWERQTVEATIELPEPVIASKGDRLVIAVPDKTFSASYHMDWNHPAIGKRWQIWEAHQEPAEIAHARTFGMLSEHKLLGLSNEVVSLTADGFTQPLRFPDEPVRHKILDLIGDLTLCGQNPLALKARFISIKAGHELDVEMAGKLSSLLS